MSDNSNVNYSISEYDQSWDKSLHNKGLSVVLLSDSADLGDSPVFDNDAGKPMIDSYVDMLSVAGNDKPDKGGDQEVPPCYEGAYQNYQSKKNAIRRIAFKDSDNNSDDAEAVKYSEENLEKYLPRWSGEGEWTVNEIEFSMDSGFYEAPFQLEMSTEAEGKIIYTLDGSIPDPLSDSSFVYGSPLIIDDATEHENVYSMRTDTSPGYGTEDEIIKLFGVGNKAPDYNVDKCTVVRAALYSNDDERLSEDRTRTFFVGMRDRESLRNTYVISMICDPDDLFDYEKGIYVLGKTNEGKGISSPIWTKTIGNYSNKGKDWERICHLEFYDGAGNTLLTQKCGVRIHGGVMRSLAQKSLNLYAREEYDGNKRFAYDFFDTGKLPKKMTLFAGGNDNRTKSSDYIINTACFKNNKIAVFNMIPCALFLNGEYWGMHYITEKYDEKYIEDKYGVADDNVIMIKNGAREDGNSDDLSSWYSMRSYIIGNDMSQEANYNKACELIDMDSYMNYYATEIYVGNRDWPANNYAAWRSERTGDSEYEDGKWRWMLFDVDYSYVLSKPEYDNIAYAMGRDPVFNSFMSNKHFRIAFANVLREVGSTYFNESKCNSIIEDFKDKYYDAVYASYKRFYGNSFEDSGIDDALSTEMHFLKERAAIINSLMKKYLISHMEEAAPSCIVAGTREYWIDEETDRKYSDPGCVNEITDAELIIPATGHHFVDKKVEATKAQKGYTLHECAQCGYSYKDSYTDFIEKVDLSDSTVSADKAVSSDEIVPSHEAVSRDNTVASEKADQDNKDEAAALSENRPTGYSSEVRGAYRISYNHNIPFWGNAKLTAGSFGDISLEYGGVSYKVSRIKVNKKKMRFKITGLNGADKELVKKVKKATSSSGGLPLAFNPYYVKEGDKVSYKMKKDGSLKGVKVMISGKKYKVNRNEWSYDKSLKIITFTGNRINGGRQVL